MTPEEVLRASEAMNYLLDSGVLRRLGPIYITQAALEDILLYAFLVIIFLLGWLLGRRSRRDPEYDRFVKARQGISSLLGRAQRKVEESVG